MCHKNPPIFGVPSPDDSGYRAGQCHRQVDCSAGAPGAREVEDFRAVPFFLGSNLCQTRLLDLVAQSVLWLCLTLNPVQLPIDRLWRKHVECDKAQQCLIPNLDVPEVPSYHGINHSFPIVSP